MAKISVIVPVYRVEAYLKRCVDSILSQSFREFDLILVDDGSPDRCPRLCDQYALQDERIHVIHRENGGLSAARNTGIAWALENSDSQWLTFVDSDDWLHGEFLQVLWDAIGPRTDLVCSPYLRIRDFRPDEPLSASVPRYMSPEQVYDSCYGMVMTACAKLIRKSLMEHLRFPEGKLHEDAFITHLLTFESRQAAVVDQEIYYYYFNPDSITRAQWNPRRLDELEAHQVRLDYLKDHGYETAWRRELEVYTVTVFEQASRLAMLCEKDKTHRAYQAPLRKKLRSMLKQCRKVGLLPRNNENKWMDLLSDFGPGIWLLLEKTRAVLQDRLHGGEKS